VKVLVVGATGVVARQLVPQLHMATALSGLGNNVRRFDQMFALTNQLRTTGTTNLIEACRLTGWPRLVVQSFCGWPWARTGGPVKSEQDPLDSDPPKAFRKTLQAIVSMEAPSHH
jgi:nucleoside-diphosphate-sugar epimerase